MDILMLPLMLLNLLGGVGSGIWLAVLRELPVIITGVVIAFSGHWPISLAVMLGMTLFGGPGIAASEGGKRKTALVLVAIHNLYLTALMTVWCLVILFIFIRLTESSSRIPTVIWAYGCSTAPWVYLARVDQQTGNENAGVKTFFMQLAFIATGVSYLLWSVTWTVLIVVFLVPMIIGFIFDVVTVVIETRGENFSR